ncbi:MAG: TM2 domain-containing protein [Bacteroidota bacterium]
MPDTKPVKADGQLSVSVMRQVMARTQARHARVIKMAASAFRYNAKEEPPVQMNLKSQFTALALAFPFLAGFFGIHRFYLGYTGNGILRLIIGIIAFAAIIAFVSTGDISAIPTIIVYGGFVFIWAFIDFLRIIGGDLKPKNGGDYIYDL